MNLPHVKQFLQFLFFQKLRVINHNVSDACENRSEFISWDSADWLLNYPELHHVQVIDLYEVTFMKQIEITAMKDFDLCS